MHMILEYKFGKNTKQKWSGWYKKARPQAEKLFKEHIGQNVKIKAAGGIRTKEDMEKFLSLGADRLGTSSAVSILEG